MKEYKGVVINMIDGSSITYKKGQVETFKWMNEGVLFIQGERHPKDTLVDERKVVCERTISHERVWVPITQIKSVKMETDDVLESNLEIRKYDKFKKHGIDITVSPISQTEVDGAKLHNEVLQEIATEDQEALKKATQAK